MSKDPVCGMIMDASEAAGRSELNGTTYYFCCSACQHQFDANPRQFIAAKLQPARIPCCGLGMVRRTVQRGTA